MGAVQNDDLTVGQQAPYWTPSQNIKPPDPQDDEVNPVVSDPVETEIQTVEPQE